ncbi:MAG TPA: menaquinone biosynthesis protein [Miltoncostaeaceae bacterium]|nr:menaquinone biosynthesis protein [Miltoncostaeaceae bacterium]
MNLLRVGRICALNMYPLFHGLERAADPRLVFTDGLPTTLNRMVLADQLDVSAMSSIAYARHADRLRLLPVASVTAAGAVDSIQLFSRVPFERVRTVAVTPHSATSVALLRVLLGERAAPFTILAGDPAAALDAHDGVLLIADEALAALRNPFAPHHTDLAEAGHRRSGLPMVFAVWAARADTAAARPAALEALERDLVQARESFRADPQAVIAAAAERFPFPADFIAPYLGRLRYEFGPPERAGLAAFLDAAVAAGELSASPLAAA